MATVTTEKLPQWKRDYLTFVFDNRRWQAFERRAGDILVCTSYKSGTTWTQMICALLIYQTPDLPAPLAEISPWLDMHLAPMEDIHRLFGAQTHRRFIKTHTPLDGLPWDPDVTYVFCGRDPRDVFMSMQNHLDNMNFERLAGLMAERGLDATPPPELPEDLNERFKLWMNGSCFEWEQDGMPFWSHFQHAATFWAFRHLPNIHFLHYADLKADLEGQMRRLARLLGINVAEDIWPSLVKAATFSSMKANADRTAPDTNHGIWRENTRFFNKGANAQWRDALSKNSRELYVQLSRQRYDRDFVDWLEQGSLAVGYPHA